MNILPKKSWHVRTKDNIARVRRDEATAREEQLKKEQKSQLAESEARLNYLRKCKGLPERSKEADSTANKVQQNLPEHVNLFVDSHSKNANEHFQKEKKEEQEKYEKKIGYLTYLGQDTNEALKLKSWYEVAPKRSEDFFSSEKGVVEKDLKAKHDHDPLTFINAVLAPSVEQKNRHTKSSKEEEKSSKKHKKHKKHKEKYGNDDNQFYRKIKDVDEKRIKLEQMRKERLKRENAERGRQEALLAIKTEKPINPENTVKEPIRVIQKYNSQFNPEFAKQNMN